MSFKSRRGSVAIQVGLMMTVIIGMLALGVEITFLLYKQRQMQSAADSAALGGATALRTGYPDYRLEAQAIAASLGFVGGVGGVTVTVNNPPATGPRTGDEKAVEAIISQPQTLTMVGLLSSPLFNVGARAVATTEGGGSTICILQYGNTAPNPAGILIDNGAEVNLARDPDTNTCGVAANSTGSRPSLLVRGGSILNTQSVYTRGTVQTSGGGVINSTEPIQMNQDEPVPDPYAGVAMPSPPFTCSQEDTDKVYKHKPEIQRIEGGLRVFCGNLTFSEDAQVVIDPGAVIIVAGQSPQHRTLTFTGNAQVTGADVTFILTRMTASGSNYARIATSGSPTVTLNAPNTGTYSGLVFFGDRNGPQATTNSFSGDARFGITGAIYFPSQTVQIGNSTRNQSDCTQLIAATIQVTATTGWSFKHDCADTGVRTIGGGSGGESKTGLVE